MMVGYEDIKIRYGNIGYIPYFISKENRVDFHIFTLIDKQNKFKNILPLITCYMLDYTSSFC
jgi:hypothetical protein